MANVDPIFLGTPKTVGVNILAADTTTPKTAYLADATEGGAVVTLSACSFDAADMIVVLSYNDGSSTYQLGEVTVVAGAGTDGATAPVNLLTGIPTLDADGSLILSAGGSLEVAAKVTVTGDIDITGIAGDY